jgi:hypothetical protein
LSDDVGTEFSYATWPEGVRAWLPRTECVALTGTRAGVRWFFIVAWSDVTKICPDTLVPVAGVSPERYETKQWPDSDQLDRLASAALIRK